MPVRAIGFLLLPIALLAGVPGCALFGSSKLEQCQNESERLLADYRQERDRANRLAEQNQQITARVAELEQRIAVLTPRQDQQRLATRPAADPSPATEPPAAVDPPSAADPPSAVDPPSAATPLLESSVPQAVPSPNDPPPQPLKPLPDPWRKAAR